jgi:cysteine desulfurase / selenocysteine lyase
MSFQLEAVRRDFPILETLVHGNPLVYLDNAASTPKCRPVIDRLHQFYQFETANIHRGVHFLSEQGTLHFEETRKTVHSFINSRHVHEIIFTKGTTESLNLVAASWGESSLKEGQVILLSTLEHHSNIVPWQLIAQKKGARVLEIPITDDGRINLEAYQHLLSSHDVAMVSVAHISNALGTINPIKQMIELAHQAGSLFTVDAAQSAAHQTIDVQQLDCDFLAFSSHKIFGPTGVGVLYGKEKLLNQMPPYQGGGDMIDVVSFEGTTFNDLPHKFEAGTPAIAEVIALKEALNYVSDLGFDAIADQEHKLLQLATDALKEIPKLRILGPALEHKSAVISFIVEGAHPHDLGMLLDRFGIAIRTGHHCTQPLMKRLGVSATARASFCFYNSEAEVQHFINSLHKSLDML